MKSYISKLLFVLLIVSMGVGISYFMLKKPDKQEVAYAPKNQEVESNKNGNMVEGEQEKLNEQGTNVNANQDESMEEDIVNVQPEPTVTPERASFSLNLAWDYKSVNANNKPLIMGDKVLSIAPMAMIDKKSGKKIWFSQHYPDSIIIEKETIIFCEGANVFAVSLNAGTDLWSFEMKHDNINTPVVQNGIVYVTSSDGSIYGLDISTGENKFEFILDQGPVPTGTLSSPVIVGNSLFYISQNSRKIYEINLDSNTLVWSKERVTSNDIVDIALYNQNLFWLSSDGLLSIMNVNSKHLTVSAALDINTGDYITKRFYEKDGIFYMFSNNQIIGIEENDGHTTLLFEKEQAGIQEAINDITIYNEKLWFITDTKLFSLDLKGTNLKEYSNEVLSGDRQNISFELSGDEVFVATSDSHLSKYIISD